MQLEKDKSQFDRHCTSRLSTQSLFLVAFFLLNYFDV